MGLDDWEWTVIVCVLLVFFLWGPNKIPDLARAIGRARREFERASKELTNPLEAPTSTPVSTPTSTPSMTGSDDTLITTAKRLGISTVGKTRDEISDEILQKANANKPPPAPPISLKEEK